MPAVMTLKPGLLVHLGTRLEGGVTYYRRDLAADAQAPQDTAVVQRWETTKVTTDPKAFEQATKCRNKAGSLVRSACVQTAFGLLCEPEKEAELDAAIAEAQALVDKHNAERNGTRVSLFVMQGRIAQTSEQAARAVVGQVRELFDEIRQRIDERDVDKMRAAASKAKKVAAMLDAETAKKVEGAVAEVRAVAKEIIKRATTSAEAVAEYVRDLELKELNEVRASFLELEEPKKVEPMPIEAAAVEVLDSAIVEPLETVADSPAAIVEPLEARDRADDSEKEMAAGAYTSPELEV